MRHRIRAIRGVEEECARLAVAVRVLDDLVEQLARADRPRHFAITRVDEFEILVVFHGAHECVGNADRDVEIADRTFSLFTANEIVHIRMVHAQHGHIGPTPCSALGHLAKRRVIDAQKAHGTTRHAAARIHSIAARAQSRKRKAVAATRLLDKRGGPQRRKDALRVASHIVNDGKNKAGGQLTKRCVRARKCGRVGEETQ